MERRMYLYYCDFGRYCWGIRLLGFKNAMQSRLLVGGVHIQYKRSIQLLQKFKLRTQVVGCDKDCLWIQQTYITNESKSWWSLVSLPTIRFTVLSCWRWFTRIRITILWSPVRCLRYDSLDGAERHSCTRTVRWSLLPMMRTITFTIRDTRPSVSIISRLILLFLKAQNVSSRVVMRTLRSSPQDTRKRQINEHCLAECFCSFFLIVLFYERNKRQKKHIKDPWRSSCSLEDQQTQFFLHYLHKCPSWVFQKA